MSSVFNQSINQKMSQLQNLEDISMEYVMTSESCASLKKTNQAIIPDMLPWLSAGVYRGAS